MLVVSIDYWSAVFHFPPHNFLIAIEGIFQTGVANLTSCWDLPSVRLLSAGCCLLSVGWWVHWTDLVLGLWVFAMPPVGLHLFHSRQNKFPDPRSRWVEILLWFSDTRADSGVCWCDTVPHEALSLLRHNHQEIWPHWSPFVRKCQINVLALTSQLTVLILVTIKSTQLSF